MRNDYVYNDRKMMKWMPFNALLEQGDHVSDLLLGREKKEMPILSEDQFTELNYQLETAYVFQSEVIVRYFKHGNYHDVQGRITRTDMMNKLIFIGSTAVYALEITNIEIL